ESRPEGRPHGAVPVGDVLDGDAAGRGEVPAHRERVAEGPGATRSRWAGTSPRPRSEEHTSELQSLTNLVCRLLLEKKNKHTTSRTREGATIMTDKPGNPKPQDKKYTSEATARRRVWDRAKQTSDRSRR